MTTRICQNRQAVGGVCLSLEMGLSCSLVPGDNLCMIEAEARPADFLSPKTKRRMSKAQGIDKDGTAACVILKA